MRLLATCAAALCSVLPAWAFDMPEGYEEVGKFSAEVNGEPLELISAVSEETEYSDLHFTGYADETRRIVKTYMVQSSADLDANGQVVPPILSVEFDQDPETGTLTPARVILVNKNWAYPFVTYPPERSREKIQIANLVFDDNGEISFDIKADLILVDWEQYKPVFDAPHIKIQGHYSGKFPAFALEYQYISGDY